MKSPFHEVFVPDCGYCKHIGAACVALREAAGQPAVEKAAPVMVECPHCDKEGYDRVYLKDGVAYHIDCGKPVNA